jgi:hypothetical protein
MKAIVIIPTLALALTGCARFSTTQSDIRYDDETGTPLTAVTTKATAWTLFSSKSELANWKATQTEEQQGAEVGSLVQQSTGTNTVAALQAIAQIVSALPK